MGCSNSKHATSTIDQKENNIDDNGAPLPCNNNETNTPYMEKKHFEFNNNNIQGQSTNEILQKTSHNEYNKDIMNLPNGMKGKCNIKEQSNKMKHNEQMEKTVIDPNTNGYKNETKKIMQNDEHNEKNVYGNNLTNKLGEKGYYYMNERKDNLNIKDNRNKFEKEGNYTKEERKEFVQNIEHISRCEQNGILNTNENNNEHLENKKKWNNPSININQIIKDKNAQKNVKIIKYTNKEDFEKAKEQLFKKMNVNFENNGNINIEKGNYQKNEDYYENTMIKNEFTSIQDKGFSQTNQTFQKNTRTSKYVHITKKE